MSRTAVAYRVLAWVVGVNLLVVFAGFFGKILTDPGSWWNRNQDVFLVIDQVHGLLFMVLVLFKPEGLAGLLRKDVRSQAPA